MKKYIGLFVLIFFFFSVPAFSANLSPDSQVCLGCHNESTMTPGIVGDWRNSRHSKTTPAEALKKPERERRFSAAAAPQGKEQFVVGCAECHTQNPETHKDTFDHNGFKVHVVVTPRDCATCHPVEMTQYDKNLMSHALNNLRGNPLYQDLVKQSIGTQLYDKGNLSLRQANHLTNTDSCYYCHGTEVTPEGMKQRKTPLGTMSFPLLRGWPNQGVGRMNPDKSIGACTPCHARHSFSIAMARSPETCSECHEGPDVPAYKVYRASKHGNIYSSIGRKWDYEAVPWMVGRDFTGPTCAECHASFIVNKAGTVLAERTHQFSDRLSRRIFGLIYSHPHPLSPDTSIIVNKAGLPLPTELTGEPVAKYLIDAKEMETRKARMEKVCSGCHGPTWIAGHFERFENTVKVTNDKTLTATKILLDAWAKNLAKGPAQKDSIFNEGIEKKWVEQWLFYANSTRFASAMAGADYGTFANGRWYLNRNIAEMYDKLRILKEIKGK